MKRETISEYFFHSNVSREMMDALWAKGWRHFGTYFFRYSQVEKEKHLFHVQPLRVRLEQATFNRTQQRTLKRNQDIKLSIKTAYIDAEIVALFERHKTRFKDNVPESLTTFLSEQPATKPCECLSLCLHLDNQLVGISYLDMGATASSSVYQCFEPSLSKRALGILMMLLAVQVSREFGKTFYYPGYAFAEPSFYDYKKTLRPLETFDWQSQWLPLNQEKTSAE
jgi:leucyl-tRNA---protein transferase